MPTAQFEGHAPAVRLDHPDVSALGFYRVLIADVPELLEGHLLARFAGRAEAVQDLGGGETTVERHAEDAAQGVGGVLEPVERGKRDGHVALLDGVG